MSRVTVKDIATRVSASHQTVVRWINQGYLKAVMVGAGQGGHWEIEEEDLKDFLQSANYAGHPEALGETEAFNRIPSIEDCYPYNLIRSVLGIDDRSDDLPDIDIWDLNVREFKRNITALTDREQRVLELRYQFGLTLDECGVVMRLTRERIRQIQAKAERKLRHWMAGGYCQMVPKSDYIQAATRVQGLEATIQQLEERLKKYEEEDEKNREAVRPDGNTPIDRLTLGVRAYNCLKRARLDTIQDILKFDHLQGSSENPYPCNSWCEIRNLGVGTLSEIARRVYEVCGYRLRKYDVQQNRFISYVPFLGAPAD